MTGTPSDNEPRAALDDCPRVPLPSANRALAAAVRGRR